jgi:hypothetical protein
LKEVGPVRLLAIEFGPEARFEGRIMDELARLERHETIRILDLMFEHRDTETGDLLASVYQGEEVGARTPPTDATSRYCRWPRVRTAWHRAVETQKERRSDAGRSQQACTGLWHWGRSRN